MLAMEASERGFRREDLIVGDEVSKAQIDHHVWLLGDAGLVVCLDSSDLQSRFPTAVALHLTWAGHEFIENSRPDGRWERAIDVAKAAGGVSVEVLKGVLTSMAKKAVGLD